MNNQFKNLAAIYISNTRNPNFDSSPSVTLVPTDIISQKTVRVKRYCMDCKNVLDWYNEAIDELDKAGKKRAGSSRQRNCIKNFNHLMVKATAKNSKLRTLADIHYKSLQQIYFITNRLHEKFGY